MVPKSEGELRIERLRARLRDKGIDGALIVYPIDVYYFSGTRQNALLWIPSEGEPVLLVRKSYTRARGESIIGDVRPMPASRELPALFSKNIRRIGVTFDVLPVQQYHFYSGILAGCEFVDISAINRELRSTKSPWEVEQLRSSGRKLSEVFSTIPSFLVAGMSEIDLAAEIEYRLKRAGTDGHLRIRAFNQDIVYLAVAGENAALPGCFDGAVAGKGLSIAAPYGPSRDPIKKNSPVIVDYAGVFNGYIVDMTRLFVIGSLPEELERAFRVSLEIEQWLVRSLRPGAVGEELFAGAVRMAESAGLGERFMGYPGEQAKFVGHGTGLELDELPLLAPRFSSPLEAGHVLAIEPKFVFPGQGTVGIENTYALTPEGVERLTDLPDAIVYL